MIHRLPSGSCDDKAPRRKGDVLQSRLRLHRRRRLRRRVLSRQRHCRLPSLDRARQDARDVRRRREPPPRPRRISNWRGSVRRYRSDCTTCFQSHVRVGTKVGPSAMSAPRRITPCKRTSTRHRRWSPRCHVWTAPSWQGKCSRRCWSLQPRVRPVSAVHMTAGHNALRGSGPGQKLAFDNALVRVGCPDRQIDR
jgi:hypothetical protein